MDEGGGATVAADFLEEDLDPREGVEDGEEEPAEEEEREEEEEDCASASADTAAPDLGDLGFGTSFLLITGVSVLGDAVSTVDCDVFNSDAEEDESLRLLPTEGDVSEDSLDSPDCLTCLIVLMISRRNC